MKFAFRYRANFAKLTMGGDQSGPISPQPSNLLTSGLQRSIEEIKKVLTLKSLGKKGPERSRSSRSKITLFGKTCRYHGLRSLSFSVESE
jgi:hypothetical protein